ncbi:MAG: TonB-dependent receptor [Pseudomonadota bacterium]
MNQPLFAAALLASAFYSVAAAQAPDSSESVEEIVVTGTALPTPVERIGAAVTVLDDTLLEQIGLPYAADVFRFVPGIAVSRTGGYGGVTQLRLRGAEGNHVLVLVDGVEVSAAGSGEFDFASLLAADVERIEVLRGPRSGLYGSNALAGVIDIQTRLPEAGRTIRGGLEYGGNDSEQAWLSLGGGGERVRGTLNWTYRRSAFDLSSDDTLGPEDDEDLNRTFSARVIADVTPDFRLEFSGRYANRDTDTDGFDFSGGPLQGLAIDDDSVFRSEDLTLGLTGTLTQLDGRSVAELSLQHTDTEGNGGLAFGSESDRDQLWAQWSWLWSADGSRRSTLFVHQEDESFRNTRPFDPTQAARQERDLTGFGIEQRWLIGDSLHLAATVRRDDNDQFEDITTWSADGAWEMAELPLRWHASVGSGATNPTFFEQFGFTPGQFKGNPDLNPEESQGWDLGVTSRLLDGALTLDLTYFDADLENEIVSFFDLTDFLSTSVNLDEDSERKGVEFAADYRSDAWTLSASYTWLDASEPAGDEVRRPEHIASLSAGYTFAGGRAQVSGNLNYNGSQLDTDFRNFFVTFAAERTRLSSYVLADLQGRYRLSNELELYARINNLFDEDYEEVLSYAAPGRTAFVGLRFSL